MSEVGLPKQIQAQLDAAEQIEQQIRGEAAPPSETPPQDPQPPAPEPQPAPQPEVTPPAPPAEDSYREKYETLQGKYSAEVPRLINMVRELQQQNEMLQQRIDASVSKPAEPQPKAEPLVTPQDEDRFGSDLVEFARRVVQEGVSAIDQRLQRLEQFAANVQQKVARVDTVAQEVLTSKQDKYWAEINEKVPDWQVINADQRWLTWLAEFDPIAGKTRQQGLDEAANALDHARVIAMFNLFKQVAGIAQAKPDPKAELARQVAPAKSSTTSSPPQGKRTYSGAEYSYWTDPRRVHDTPQEQLQSTLAELEQALQEGRIQW